MGKRIAQPALASRFSVGRQRANMGGNGAGCIQEADRDFLKHGFGLSISYRYFVPFNLCISMEIAATAL